MSDGDRPLDNDWVLGPEPLEINMGHDAWDSRGGKTLESILMEMPSRNGERVRRKKGERMSKEEVTEWLRVLFNITDQLSVDVVWEHMNELWAEEDGEC